MSELVDERLRIQLAGLLPDVSVVLRATMRDDLGRVWSAEASFLADAAGTVDLATQAPLSSGYAGIDPMGLCWSMALDPAERRVSPFAKRDLAPSALTLTAEAAGMPVASATITRRFVAPDVSRIPVREKGLVGTLFLPPGTEPHPGVLVLGGSSGGLQETAAALLGSRGFSALALAYFAFEQLPQQHVNIPLEYFATALDWMARHPRIREDRLAVLGRSRGAELALLLGATYRQVRAVVAYAPSAVLWAGTGGPAWTLHDEALPYMHDRLSPEESDAMFAQEPSAATPWYLANLEDASACEDAAIPVERTAGPILLISGEDDQMWPATLMGERLMQRLTQHQFPYRAEHLRYPGAGHLIGSPYLPTTVNARRHPVANHTFLYGGNARDHARAEADSWPRVLALLRESLT